LELNLDFPDFQDLTAMLTPASRSCGASPAIYGLFTAKKENTGYDEYHLDS
jgi:hypothetical protein